MENYESLNVEFLGKPIHIVRDKLAAQLTLNCLELKQIISGWLKNAAVNLELKTVTLESISLENDGNHIFSTFSHKQNGLVYITISPNVLMALSDHFYADEVARIMSTITSSDIRVQERVSKQILTSIAPEHMWHQHPFTVEQCLGIKVEMTMVIGEKVGTINVIINNEMIATLIEELGLKKDDDLSTLFTEKLTQTPVQLNVLLCKKRMLLSDVMQLAPNDILPIELLSNVPVSIGNEQLFTGRVAESNGQLVLTLNHD